MQVFSAAPEKPEQAPQVGKNFSEDFTFAEEVPIRGTIPDVMKGPVVIEFFSTWCGPCKQIIPHLIRWSLAYKNVPCVQISPEAVDKLQKFYHTVKVPYNVAKVSTEMWETLGNLFQFTGIPFSIILENGVCLYAGYPAGIQFLNTWKTLNEKYAPAKVQ